MIPPISQFDLFQDFGFAITFFHDYKKKELKEQKRVFLLLSVRVPSAVCGKLSLFFINSYHHKFTNARYIVTCLFPHVPLNMLLIRLIKNVCCIYGHSVDEK